MTESEKYFKLAELQQQMERLEDERRALEATPVTTPHKVWEAEYGKKYWSSAIIQDNIFNVPEFDGVQAKAGLAHQSAGQAERHHSFLVMLHDLHKFAVEHNEGWKPGIENGKMGEYIGYDHEEKSFFVKYDYASQYSILPYLRPGYGIANKAIDTFGDSLKILFEYYNS